MFSVNLRIPGPSQVITHLCREAETVLIPALSKQGQHIVVIGIAAGKVIGHALALNGLRIAVL